MKIFWLIWPFCLYLVFILINFCLETRANQETLPSKQTIMANLIWKPLWKTSIWKWDVCKQGILKQGISCNYCFYALEILERSRLIYSDVLFTLLCSSPARKSFQNNPQWQHCCFSYYCLALSLSILLEGLQSTWLFDFAHILGKMTKSGMILENEISRDLFKISRAWKQYFQEMPWPCQPQGLTMYTWGHWFMDTWLFY